VSWLLRPDRLWMFGALAGAVALSALAWFLLIGPQRTETTDVEDQTAQADGQVIVEQRKLARLTAEYAERDRYAAELAANRKALPTVAATGDLLRELQSAGDGAGVTVSSLSAGSPAELKGAAGVASVTISVAAAGKLEKLQAFLDQVQRIQPRAMLVFNVSFEPNDSGGPITGTGAQLTLSAQVFVAMQQAPSASASASASTAAGAD
jgi:Tfp pilus assembly protein PilO